MLGKKHAFPGCAVSLLLFFVSPLFLMPETGNPDLKILVNQAGYDLDRPKLVLLQANFNPELIADYEVLKDGQVVFRGRWKNPQTVEAWGLWYKEAVIPLATAGTYVVRLSWEGKAVASPPFAVAANRILRHTAPLAAAFFYAQRCGIEVPGWHAACHLDDARLPDGSHRDLVGGWHDAGDYNKYNGYTPLAVYALAKFALSPSFQAMPWRSDLPLPREEALWGAEWLAKCLDEKTGNIIGRVFSGFSFWGPPEAETDNVVGTADDRPADIPGWNENELTVAAWAAVFELTGNSVWRDRALSLWDRVAARDPGIEIASRARRLLAAVELFRITHDSTYGEAAQKEAVFLLSRQEADGTWPPWPLAVVDYGMPAAALAKFATCLPESAVSPVVREALSRYADGWARLRVQPFAIPRWSDRDLFYLYRPDAWHVGQNSMYLSQAWAGLLIGRAIPTLAPEVKRLASGCLDWVLGLNPFGICMMEAAGSVHLKKYHHRYDRIPNGRDGRVPGAICNGVIRETPESDRPYLDLEGNSWQTNEPWLPHDAYFLLVLSEWEGRERTPPRTRTER